MHYSISTQDSLLEVRLEDGLTKAQVLDLWTTLESHPKYYEVTAGLAICGRNLQWHLNATEIRQLARESSRLRELPWAIVAQDPLSFGMVRMFALQTDAEERYQIFSNESAAREWLQQFLPAPN